MKRVFVFCVTVFIFTGLCSCVSAPASVSGQDGSSVWKISANGNTLFLGGSIHMLRSEDFPLPEEFDWAFAASSMLILEADIEQMSDMAVAEYMMVRMMLPPGRTLNTVLDSKTYVQLVRACAEYGIAEANISGFKPSMVIAMLSALEIQKYGFLESGVDLHFLGQAKNAEMPVGFLETVESQIDIIAGMGDGYENDFVKYSLEDMDNSEKELASIVYAWRSGDIEFYETLAMQMKEEWPVLYQTLLKDRNAAWMPLLREYCATPSVEFVIVGLAHLHGPDGLLRQLADSGYAVEQLR